MAQIPPQFLKHQQQQAAQKKQAPPPPAKQQDTKKPQDNKNQSGAKLTAAVVGIEARGNKWVCYNKSTGHIYGTFSTKQAAQDQMDQLTKGT